MNYLKEGGRSSSDKNSSFKYFQKLASVSEISPK